MLAESNKPFSLTELQLQQLKRTTHNLRKLNRDSLRALQRLKHPGLTKTKYREAGNAFEILALQVISALRFREAVLSSARDQRIDVIVHIRSFVLIVGSRLCFLDVRSPIRPRRIMRVRL
jgi:hypothetical protein